MALSLINKCDIIILRKNKYNSEKEFVYKENSSYTLPIVCKYDQHDLLIKNGYKLIYDNYYGSKVYFKNLDINLIKIRIRNSFSINKYKNGGIYCNTYIDIFTYDKYDKYDKYKTYLDFFSTGYQTKCFHSIDSMKDLRTSFACELLKELLSERQIKNLNKKLKWFHSLQLANIKMNCLQKSYGVVDSDNEVIETYMKINKKK